MPLVKSVFFGNSPRQYAAKSPRRLGFKSSPTGFDNGRFPSCAINGSNRFIEVHMGEDNDTLNFRQGRLERLDFRFTDSPGRPKIGDGRHPAVAFNDSNVAIVMADQNDKVKYAAATVNINADANPPFSFTTFSQTGATYPSVALNAAGVVVEVHQSGNDLAWRRGKLAGTTLTWSAVKSLITNGTRPSVAINNNGMVVVLFERGGKLVYLTGTFDKSKTAITEPIQFAKTATAFVSSGNRPSVALTDTGEVYVTHSNGGTLYQTVGTLSGSTITLQDFLVQKQTTYMYDQGSAAHVATNGKVALQMFHIGDEKLVGNASLVFDRANWMGDQRDGVLKGKTLRQIAFPGSHDAGAFAGGNIAQTQDLSIREQLRAGVRYFDLRPEFSGDKKKIDVNTITTYHDIGRNPAGDYRGPTFPNLVRSIRLFMSSHNELVILRISQFKNFDANVFKALAGVFVGDAAQTTGLKKWLFPLKTGKRLADRPLTDFLQQTQGTVLIVVDVDGSNINPSDKPVDYITDAYRQSGLYRYRDWYAKDPAKGDLTVFDVFSDTNTFSTMSINAESSGSQYAIPPNNKKLPRGQLDKFDWLDGLCQKDDKDPKKRSTVQCDLFLNSWTLTPSFPTLSLPNFPTAFGGADRANQNLTSYFAIPAFQNANPQGQQMNILYADAVEFSRAVDVAMIRNGFGR